MPLIGLLLLGAAAVLRLRPARIRAGRTVPGAACVCPAV